MKLNHTYKTANYSARTQVIDTVILHYTEVAFKEAVRLLCGAEYEVSAHYLIAKDGGVFQLASHDVVTWHAGSSKFKGREKYNEFSIGIEIENSGLEPFTLEQYQALSELLANLHQEHNIKNILGHSDVAPLRKRDPGPYFNWQKLAIEGFVSPTKELSLQINKTIWQFGDEGEGVLNLQKQLAYIGYDVQENGKFDRHFNLISRAFFLRHYQEKILTEGAHICFNQQHKYTWNNTAITIIQQLC